ncbi:hypothetical protein, partial [Rhizobium pisi]
MTVRRPSSIKIERAKWIASRINQSVPESALGDDKELSAWVKIHDPASDCERSSRSAGIRCRAGGSDFAVDVGWDWLA